jgi:hypothetical protein
MKNAVFLDVTERGSCKNRRFGETYRLHHQADKNQRTRNWLLVTANVVPSSLIHFTLIMEVIRSSEIEAYGVTSQKAAFFNFLVTYE